MSLADRLRNDRELRDSVVWLGEWYGEGESGGEWGKFSAYGEDWYCMFLHDVDGNMWGIEIERNLNNLLKNYENIGKTC